ncbi:MAG: UDP-N-acetylmuramate--L-alanine ligase [Desulfobacterales bacterium C00003104]|nr:MAG: UDP-N-acetylmuramate--L-alanine ligase [Desulfobacterales bacterium C00003104]
MYQKKYHLHFVGIGGIGMSGIAELLINLGYEVSGSDLVSSNITTRLASLGARVYEGHLSDHIDGADVVVISSAVRADNPEVVASRASAVPVIPRAEMLAELMHLKYGIAVAGAHGKTTTTSIVAEVLNRGALDPTVVIGGRLNSLGTNAVLGGGEFIVAEADESDGSFLHLSPTITVVTNIDAEHLDYYKDMDQIKAVFLDFINKVPFYGLAVLCLDNEHIQRLIPKIVKRYATYGLTTQADCQAKEIVSEGLRSRFQVLWQKKKLGAVCLNLPGLHNIYNALASVVVGIELGIGFNMIKAALEKMQGVQRRFQLKGNVGGIIFVDDYGHHPTEIRATLDTVRQCWPDRRIVVIFQPHRYTRTAALFEDFTRAFYRADSLVVLPIYPAGEIPIPGVEGEILCEGIKAHGHKDATFKRGVKEVLDHLSHRLDANDVVLTLGAGPVWKVGEEIIRSIGSGSLR